MTAQIQTIFQANPVTTAVSRAEMGQLKLHIHEVARNYCSIFHAQRTGQLRVLMVRASQAQGPRGISRQSSCPGCSAPYSSISSAASPAAGWGLLHEYADQSTYDFHHLHRHRQQSTIISHLQQRQGSPVADLCIMHGRQQADSIIVNFPLG